MASSLQLLLASLCVASLNQVSDFALVQEQLNSQNNQDQQPVRLAKLEQQLKAIIILQDELASGLISSFLAADSTLDECKQQCLALLTKFNQQLMQSVVKSGLAQNLNAELVTTINANLAWNESNIGQYLNMIFDAILKPTVNFNHLIINFNLCYSQLQQTTAPQAEEHRRNLFIATINCLAFSQSKTIFDATQQHLLVLVPEMSEKINQLLQNQG